MLTIRLSRVGKKNKAQFKILLQENTEAPGGRHVAVLGSYDPHSKQTTLDAEKIKYWIEKGAKASDSVHNILVSKGVISGKKRVVKLPKKEVPAEEVKEEAKTEEVKEEVKEEAAAPIEETKAEEVKTEKAK